MRSFGRKLFALCILSAALAWVPVAQADPLTATGFHVGSQQVTLTSQGFPTVIGPTVSAGAFDLNPPAGVIAYCIDIFHTLSFGTAYTNYTPHTLASDVELTAARKSQIAQLFHGFYDTSLTSSTNTAAFQLALWEIVFETTSDRNVDSTDPTKGTTYATDVAHGGSTPANVISTADSWLGQLNNFSTDLDGFTTYRSYDHQDLIGYHHVPEPPTWMLLFAGVGTLVYLRRRRLTI